MTAQDREIVPFSKFIRALDPWLGQVVLIGEWARRLYRLDSRARDIENLPLTTLDGDVAVPTKLKVEEWNVRNRLLEAGFRNARKLPAYGSTRPTQQRPSPIHRAR
jgi:hypothetical protein